ncbi:MAG: SpoIID/LytB domain-containing protein [Candidatus Riflebacteria bacterium]|nr:SpoIID/LytB domain-containing protein [Candidatus Riflebacteria bacterium]
MTKLLSKWFFLVLLLLTSALNAQVLDQQNVKVGICPQDDFTTLRVQSFSGNWKVEFGGASQTREFLAEGEDNSMMLVPKGLVARFSTGKDFNGGYKKIILSGGELLNLEIPDHQPILLQGIIEIAYDETSIRIVNTVTVHQYIVSTLSKIAITNEPEALKALCIMARTRIAWVLANTAHKEEAYNVCDSEHCMEFDGCGFNRELVDILTNMTTNKVLKYHDKLIMPRFHDTCGGKISSAKDIFSVDEPYHQAKPDLLDGKGSENCFHSPGFHWSIELQKVDVLDFLSLSFAGGAERVYTGWEPEKIDSNGRIQTVTIRGRVPKIISGNEFHENLKVYFGPNSIKSMKFTMELLRRTVIFRGMGDGDGVGLCLYGADGLAKKSQKHLDILKFYYPGTDVK